MRSIFFTLLFIAALVVCRETSARETGPLQNITVSFTFQPECTLFHVALAKGYFVEEGLRVQPLMHTYGKNALQSVLDHKADFATAGETPIMFNVLKGEKILVVANIGASATNNAIVARRDSGIAAPGDLKGKRIGYTPGTTGDFFLDSLLTANGLTRMDIQPVALAPEEMLDAVMAKKVDAAATWNYPLTQTFRQLGSNGILIQDRDIYTETFNIVAQQDFISKNPETVSRFLRALIKAEDFVARNPDEAQTMMSIATKVDKNLIHDVWNVFDYRVVLDQALLVTLEDETRWAMKKKLTEQTIMPDYLSFIYPDSLMAIKPEAVKLNR